MTESKTHLLMKNAVSRRLMSKGYDLFYEPLESPLKMLFWDHYKPDILGIKKEQDKLDLVIVECETHPSMYRMADKNRRIKKFLSIQERLGQRSRLRMLLVIPPKTLSKINCRKVRQQWNIWIMNSKGRLLYII